MSLILSLGQRKSNPEIEHLRQPTPCMFYVFKSVLFSLSIHFNEFFCLTANIHFSSWLSTSICLHSYTDPSHSNQVEKGSFSPHLLSCLFPPVQKLNWAYSKSSVWVLISTVLISHKRVWAQRGNQALFKVMPPGVHCQ